MKAPEHTKKQQQRILVKLEIICSLDTVRATVETIYTDALMIQNSALRKSFLYMLFKFQCEFCLEVLTQKVPFLGALFSSSAYCLSAWISGTERTTFGLLLKVQCNVSPTL